MSAEAVEVRARAAAALGMRRSEEAKRLLQPLVAADPQDAVALVLLGRAYLAEQRLEQVHEMCRRAVEVASDDVAVLVECADMARQSNDLSAAYTWAQRALTLDPDEVAAINVLGLVQTARGGVQEGVLLGSDALKRRPGDPDLLVAYGMALAAAKRPGDATAQYALALERDPEHIHALNNLAVSRLQCGDLRLATSLLGRALALDPRMSRAQQNLRVVGVLARRILLSRLVVVLGLTAAASLLGWRFAWLIAAAGAVWCVAGIARLPAPARARLADRLGWIDAVFVLMIVLAAPAALFSSSKAPPIAAIWGASFALAVLIRQALDRLAARRCLRALGARLPRP
ncbi:MAG: tetratricopeptide repeat protein [Candidatus Nanopelagicales bacterium]